MNFEASETCALELDRNDPLRQFRDRFLIPEKNGKEVLYFCGNSLGLQPGSVAESIGIELHDWHHLGVEGHFQARNRWFDYHKFLKPTLVELTGAKDRNEVTPMGSLTSNLHLMLASFYRPNNERYQVIMESGAFSSDRYAVETQCRFHGLEPEEAIIELHPQKGAHTLQTSEILRCIEENRDQLAIVLLSGVQYYSGQFFDIETITRAGHEAGAYVGWDLAHAIGNVPLSLHRHQVDFAVWCSYKYLNSGPGATGGLFVHEKHGRNPELKRFGGWWGHDENERFLMKKGFKPTSGSDGWQLSNANILSMAAQKASLELFSEAGIDRIRTKSLQLTGFLEFLLEILSTDTGCFSIITPRDPAQRGAQLSLLFHEKGKGIYRKLKESGVIVDWREPDTVRVAPVPLYNSFQEVFRFSRILKSLLN